MSILHNLILVVLRRIDKTGAFSGRNGCFSGISKAWNSPKEGDRGATALHSALRIIAV